MSRKKEKFVSSNLYSFPIAGKREEPTALERERTTLGQIDWGEDTIIWGQFNNLPIRILDAINQSPTTTSCLGTVAMFTKGSGFVDPGIGAMVIDKDGTTLDELHAQLCANLTNLEGFAVNFKFDGQGKITNTYCLGLETLRFTKPPTGSKTITAIKHNPYWGTSEYKLEFTTAYPLWNPLELDAQIKTLGTKFPGQVYFYGTTKAPYKFYPVPKFWSGEKWIYSDAKIATYVDELLGNGFFQSVLMQVIGDPNEWSTNPRTQEKIVGADGVTRTQPTKTVGEEFNDQMSQNFSGVQKAGTAFVKWVGNKDQVVDIQPFPTTADFGFFEGVLLNTMRAITVATQVPAILANLPNSLSSLASGGDAVKNAIDLMQSNTTGQRKLLENFYNNIMLPNLQKSTGAKVKIKNYIPITTQVTVDKEIWAWLNDAEKADFVTNNIPNMKIIRTIAPPAPVPAPGTAPMQVDPVINENLKNLKLSEINRVSSIVSKYEKGLLTFDQGKQLLSSYGFTEEQINAWLKPTYETINSISVSQ